jgi:hypothetical protein
MFPRTVPYVDRVREEEKDGRRRKTEVPNIGLGITLLCLYYTVGWPYREIG